MNKRDVRDRILEIFASSDLEVAGWDETAKDELAEELATAMIKLEMETVFDEEVDDEDEEPPIHPSFFEPRGL